MRQIISFILAALLLVGGVIGGLFYMQNYEDFYYTKVDNSQVRELSGSSDMKYEYSLNSYNSSGKKKKQSFKTSRKLKEDAYLQLQVRSFGVHKWKEVSFEELPEKVQSKIDKK